MEQKKKDPLTRFRRARLSTKLMLSVGTLIFCSNLIIMLLVCRTSIVALRQKTYDQLQGQLSTSASIVNGTVDDVVSLMTNLTSTTYVRTYAAGEYRGPIERLDTDNSTMEAMRVLINSGAAVDYAALIPTDGGRVYLYVGEIMTDTAFRETTLADYLKATVWADTSVRYLLQTDLYDRPELTLYLAVYDTYLYTPEQPLAVLAVGINTDQLAQYLATDAESLTISLVDETGLVLASGDTSLTGTQSDLLSGCEESSGQFTRTDRLVAYSREEEKGWIIVGSAEKKTVFAQVYNTSFLIEFVIVFFTLMAIGVSLACCRWFYAPINEIISRMERVTQGELNTKMPLYEEVDFRQLSEGFNSMTESVQNLIQEVHRQEQENTEIRLNALQSQIKPHFLYNTLNCIHWMALAEGNREVSRTVMALSKYYRLCLSKGQDVVPLSQELEHTDSYVTIQNILFDDIVQVEYDIDPRLTKMEIPKITLQPLVENAIAHGIKVEDDRKGRIRIQGIVREEDTLLTVEDDGVGMSGTAMAHLNDTIDVLINDGSYGVKNVHQRLKLHYGRGYGLHYRRSDTGGVLVEIRLPLPEEQRGTGKEQA